MQVLIWKNVILINFYLHILRLCIRIDCNTEKINIHIYAELGINMTRSINFLFLPQIVSPLLKYLSSDIFTQEHWMDLYRMLKMPRSTALERMTFGDILKTADQIVANAAALKVSKSRASSFFKAIQGLYGLLWPFHIKHKV